MFSILESGVCCVPGPRQAGVRAWRRRAHRTPSDGRAAVQNFGGSRVGGCCSRSLATDFPPGRERAGASARRRVGWKHGYRGEASRDTSISAEAPGHRELRFRARGVLQAAAIIVYFSAWLAGPALCATRVVCGLWHAQNTRSCVRAGVSACLWCSERGDGTVFHQFHVDVLFASCSCLRHRLRRLQRS